MASLPVSQIRGTNAKQVTKLRASGVRNADQLLDRAGSDKGRKELAAATGLSNDAVLELVNRADLARVKGIGRQYSNLLEDCGVDTVKELAQRKPDNLQPMLAEKASKSGVKRAPTMREVTSWVSQAKALPRRVSY
jgi:predicted flap endonuclease-1-like 5' DNA nuclease